MSSSVNKVIIIGNLGADPDIKRTQDGRPIANLSIATSDTWKDKNTGERKEKTEWHRVVVFNEGLCRVIENYVKKGSKVYIEGQLQTHKWQDNEGKDRWSTEVVLQNYNGVLTMLDSKVDNQVSKPSAGQAQSQRSEEANHSDNIIDDEIPF